MGGYWLQNLLDSIEVAQEGKGPFIIGYASVRNSMSLSHLIFQHTEVTLSVMRLMGIDKNELTTSAGFVLEFRTDPRPSVRLLNHDPNPIDRHVIYQAKYVEALAEKQDSDGFIPLEDFVSYASAKVGPHVHLTGTFRQFPTGKRLVRLPLIILRNLLVPSSIPLP